MDTRVKGLGNTGTCGWCHLVGCGGGHVVYEERAFVVVDPPAGLGARCITLVPKTHVGAVTDLPVSDRGDVFAGLSRVSKSLRGSLGVEMIEIRAQSGDPSTHSEHLHFDLLLEPSAAAGNSSAVASLVNLGL